jgi:hypothetical protein
MIQWPFENFRLALSWYKPDEMAVNATGRWQNVNAAYNGIERGQKNKDVKT